MNPAVMSRRNRDTEESMTDPKSGGRMPGDGQQGQEGGGRQGTGGQGGGQSGRQGGTGGGGSGQSGQKGTPGGTERQRQPGSEESDDFEGVTE
jgi:hypothetical protein